MSDEKSTVNSIAPTPVAPIPLKNWQSRLLILAAGSVVLGGIFFQHVTKAKEELHEEETTPAVAMAAPQLTPLEQELNQIEQPITKQTYQESQKMPVDEEVEKLERMRMVAPTTVYSTSTASAQSQRVNQGRLPPDNAVLGGNGTGDGNTQFMARLSDSGVSIANATRMKHPGTTLAQGTMIWATLETRMVSDLPGMVRAVTSEDIYSEDGSQILLPKGSKLIGQYSNGITLGQKRFFAVWQRVIRPDHISVQLSSPGTDPLGAAGIGADAIDKHFFEQFGTSILLSIISAGASNVGVSPQDQLNSASSYREALSNSFAQTAQNTLVEKGTINDTLYKDQGAAISVFVARDLDFYDVLTSSQGRL